MWFVWASQSSVKEREEREGINSEGRKEGTGEDEENRQVGGKRHISHCNCHLAFCNQTSYNLAVCM